MGKPPRGVQTHFLTLVRILYIKATVVSVYGDKEGKARRPGQLLRGAGRGAISIKEILVENRGTCI